MEVAFKFILAALCSPQNIQPLMKCFLSHPAPKGRLLCLAAHLGMYTNRVREGRLKRRLIYSIVKF